MTPDYDAAARKLIVAADPALREKLDGLALSNRMLFVAGLPGTGKTLLVNQLAQIALGLGREVTLLQWDIARPDFESTEAGRRYPLVDGITQVPIRRAVGLWARDAVASWAEASSAGIELLIGEAPLIGGRLIELARVEDDTAETSLADEQTRFLITSPSAEVHRHTIGERERRFMAPLHANELDDAPPHLLAGHWRELIEAAQALGVLDLSEALPAYDASLYERLYARVLRHRQCEVIAIDRVLPTSGFSPYEIDARCRQLRPTPDEGARYIEAVERQYPDRDVLEREIEAWYLT